MDNALNEKLDLSALHLGIISVGALLGAVVTLVVCILAVRIITVLLRRVLGKRPAPEFEEWLERTGILSAAGELLPPGGHRGMAALGRELEEGRHGN